MTRDELITQIDKYTDTFVEGYSAYKIKSGLPSSVLAEAKKLDLIRDYHGLLYFNADNTWAKPRRKPSFDEWLFFTKHKILKMILGDKHIYTEADQKKLWEIRGGENYGFESETQESKQFAQKFFRELFQLKQLAKDAAILELGCGSGRNMMVLKDLGYTNILGVDFSETQIKYCHGLGLNVRRMDITNLDFNDSSFEFVFTNSVLLHVPPQSIEKTIREAVRVTRGFVGFREHSYDLDNYKGHVYKRNYENLINGLGFKVEKTGEFFTIDCP